MSTAKNKSLVRQLLEVVVNRQQLERIPEFIAPSFRDRTGGIRGIKGNREHVETFLHCYPDVRVRIRGQVAERDWVVTWFEAVGTNLGGWQGIPPTGKRLRLKGVRIDRIRNGRIVEHWGAANTLEALLQPGVVRWVKKPKQVWLGRPRRLTATALRLEDWFRGKVRSALYRLTTPPKDAEKRSAAAPGAGLPQRPSV
jgi:predicted ester cyclase